MSSKCRVCFHTTGAVHSASETMFGTGERFDYFECVNCGALSIVSVPDDLGSHYDAGYYSMTVKSRRGLRGVARLGWDRLSAKNAVAWGGRADRVLSALHSPPDLLRWSVFQKAGFKGRIVDVGSGQGILLQRLADMGFRDLLGIDPFLVSSTPVDRRVELRRCGIEELTGEFDLVMFNHSFEHVVDVDQTIAAARDRLAADGELMLRVPLAQCEAWHTYGTDWAQLDPPRHIVLHTPRSIEVLAERHGLVLDRVVFDSTGFQFWGSEQIRSGIWLQDENSWAVNPKKSAYVEADMERFARQAAALNAQGTGDQAAFVLRRA